MDTVLRQGWLRSQREANEAAQKEARSTRASAHRAAPEDKRWAPPSTSAYRFFSGPPPTAVKSRANAIPPFVQEDLAGVARSLAEEVLVADSEGEEGNAARARADTYPDSGEEVAESQEEDVDEDVVTSPGSAAASEFSEAGDDQEPVSKPLTRKRLGRTPGSGKMKLRKGEGAATGGSCQATGTATEGSWSPLGSKSEETLTQENSLASTQDNDQWGWVWNVAGHHAGDTPSSPSRSSGAE